MTDLSPLMDIATSSDVAIHITAERFEAWRNWSTRAYVVEPVLTEEAVKHFDATRSTELIVRDLRTPPADWVAAADARSDVRIVVGGDPVAVCKVSSVIPIRVAAGREGRIPCIVVSGDKATLFTFDWFFLIDIGPRPEAHIGKFAAMCHDIRLTANREAK
jgi:hypothetical protein